MLAATALAQTSAPGSTAPGSNAPAAPATTAPSTAAPSAASGAASTLASQNQSMQGHWRASKLMGVDIYGPNNEKVGDVTEVLVDKSGKITAVTVGVGGFLGIGAKDVAVKFEEVTWSMQPMASTAAGTAATGTATTNTAATGTAAPRATGTAATGTAATGTASSTAATDADRMNQMYPDHGKINMTKDQLKSAPAVTYSNS
jgi:sporulation protein YlmC with PRC-barrel domain